MSVELELNVTQWDKKSGGDKYETTTEKGEPFVPYIPQSISRTNGKKVKKFKVTLEPLEFEN